MILGLEYVFILYLCALLKCYILISDVSSFLRRMVAFEPHLTCNRVKLFPLLDSVSVELMHNTTLIV